MLQVKNAVKTYVTGDLKQDALKGVSVNFRNNEFVSILGHSGSGKTTLLNIIGGLDRYTSGDLIINGVSTKKYTDADWDAYRNHKVGFIFQSYNLIPHQSILANVEMALTISGVSKKERRKRALKALDEVGLSEHINKKPNQLSGGQMQRVAIARALVNDPEILLADEPTGALDSETSVQIMELLKDIAKDKLVIMVTHNPELAEQYSTRTVRLTDGVIVSDTDPYAENAMPAKPEKHKKTSMSFLTALTLSSNNLKTKKGRTLLTAFAGSIGIIGIALILALSSGMNLYISSIQKNTMNSYPITINSQAFDTSVLSGFRSRFGKTDNDERVGVYADYGAMQTSNAFVSNNLTEFKKYIEDENSEIREYIGENGVVYGYDVAFSVFSYDDDGKFISSKSDPDENNGSSFSFKGGSFMSKLSSGIKESSNAENFSEIMKGTNGEAVSRVVTDNYELVHGRWPEKYDETILVLDKNSSVSAKVLYQLGLITKDDYTAAENKTEDGNAAEDLIIDYDKICDHKFYLTAACDHYKDNGNGTFTYTEDLPVNENTLKENAVELKITGIIRPAGKSFVSGISTTIGYTSDLTDYIIKHTAESAVVKAQTETPDINILNGIKFTADTEEEKILLVKEFIGAMGISDKADLYKIIMYYNAQNGEHSAQQSNMQQMTSMSVDETTMAALLDRWLANDSDSKLLLELYDQYIGNNCFEDNMKAFGSISYDSPSSISIYVDDFESKEAIAKSIEDYNANVDDDLQISYTDYVAAMTSSLSGIINGISYVLIAFVAVSLIVSCIMIGIITRISVMERTKEIGILRALGASKSNISQVFNAETFIIGCCSGVIGIGITLLALFPINAIIGRLVGSGSMSAMADMTAHLSLPAAIVLIVISIAITMLGGLLPAKKAAKKDPVVALRTE